MYAVEIVKKYLITEHFITVLPTFLRTLKWIKFYQLCKNLTQRGDFFYLHLSYVARIFQGKDIITICKKSFTVYLLIIYFICTIWVVLVVWRSMVMFLECFAPSKIPDYGFDSRWRHHNPSKSLTPSSKSKSMSWKEFNTEKKYGEAVFLAMAAIS